MNFSIVLLFSIANCAVFPLLESYHPRDLVGVGEDNEFAANRLLHIIDMLTFRYSHINSKNFESPSVGKKVYEQQRLKTLNIFHKGARFRQITASNNFAPQFDTRGPIALYTSCYHEDQPDRCERVGLPYPGGCDRVLVKKFLLHAPKMETVLKIQMDVIQESLTPVLPLPVPIVKSSPFYYDFIGLPRYDPGYTEWPSTSVLKALALYAKQHYRPFTLKIFEHFLLNRIYPGAVSIESEAMCSNFGTNIRILRLRKQSVDIIYPGEAIFDFVKLIRFKDLILPGPLQSHVGACSLNKNTRFLLLHSLEEFREYDSMEFCSHISIIMVPPMFIPPLIKEGSHLITIHFPRNQDNHYNERTALHGYLNRVHVPFDIATKGLNPTAQSITEFVDIIYSYAYKDGGQEEVFHAAIEATNIAVYDQGIIYSTPTNIIYKRDFDNDPYPLMVSCSSAKVKYLSVSEDGNSTAITYDCNVVTIYDDTTKVSDNFTAHQGLISANGKASIFQVNVMNKTVLRTIQVLGLLSAFLGGFVTVCDYGSSFLLPLFIIIFVGILGVIHLRHCFEQTAVVIHRDGKLPESLMDCELLHTTRNIDIVYLQHDGANFQISLTDDMYRRSFIRAGQDFTHVLRLEPNASLTEILSNLQKGQFGTCSNRKSFWYSTFLESVCNHETNLSSDLSTLKQNKSRVILIRNKDGKKYIRILQPIPSKPLLTKLIFSNK